MPEGTIDKLSIEIAGSSSSAAQNINELASSLKELQGSVGDGAAKLEKLAKSMQSLQSATTGVRLGSLATAIEKIASAVSLLPADTASRLGGLQALSTLGAVKVSSTIGKTVSSVSQAVSALPEGAVGKLAGLTSALRPLGDLNGVKVGELTKLPAVLKEFSSLNLSALSTQMKELNASLAPLATSVQRLSTAYGAMPKSMRSAGVAAKSVASANNILASSNARVAESQRSAMKTLGSWVSSISTLRAKVVGLGHVLKNTLGAAINEVNQYIENMNLFQASMGQYADEAQNFGKKVQDLMGIDFGEWARNQGVFMTLATGMGVTADKASVMSQQLTQLGYDISSFYNLDVKEAMLKLQSGLAGELEPLRRIGWDLSNARMNVELAKMGIDANAQSMTQAEKVALRYKMIMEQVTITHGDMARTLASPANQIRVLRAQLTLAARAVGNLFIPALNAILPVAIGVVKAIRLVAEAIASVFGIDATFEVDYSTLDTSGIATGVEDTADAFDDAGSAAEEAEKKVKEYQNTVMGFDELNKLNATPEYDDGSGKGGEADDLGGIGGGADFGLPTYDFLEGLDNYITKLSDTIAQKLFNAIKMLTPVVAGVGAAFALWKIAPGLAKGLSTLSGTLRGIAKDAGHTASRFHAMGKTKFAGVSSNIGKLTKGLSLASAGLAAALQPAVLLPWVAAIGLVVGHFSNLAVNSENFRRGLGAIKDLFEGWGEFVEKVKKKVGKLIDRFKNWWDNIDVNFPALVPFKNFIDTVAEKLQWVGGVLAEFGAQVNEVFDLQWTDALMAAGIALAFFTENPAFVAFLSIAEGISLAIRAIGWATSPVVEEVDALAGVSEETAAAFGTSIDSMENAIRRIDEIDFADAVVNEEDVAAITSDIEDIVNVILNNLDRERNEELASLDLLSEYITDEEKQALIDEINQHYDNRIEAVKNGQSEIAEIMQQAYENGETLSDENAKRIRDIQDEMYQALLDTSGAGEDEIAKIRDAGRNNQEAIALESASNIIKGAQEAYDQEMQDAKANYDNMISVAERHKDEMGGVEDDKYKNLIASAEQYYSDAEAKAEDHKQTTLDNLQQELQEASDTMNNGLEDGLVDLNSKLDWETGEIRTKTSEWTDAFSNWVYEVEGWWERLRNSLNVPAVGKIEVHGEVVDFVGQDTGYYGGEYATGGFPTSGQLFMAREDGNPELVGRMGRRTAVANTGQIVEGIEAGVTNAMLQVLPAFSGGNSGDVTMVLNVDSETLARATQRGAASAMRRGQLTPELSFA